MTPRKRVIRMDLKVILQKALIGNTTYRDCVQYLAYLDCWIFFIEKKMTPQSEMIRKLLLARLNKSRTEVTSMCGCN
jgi:hypothetical protein